jgi:hypothetical protein
VTAASNISSGAASTGVWRWIAAAAMGAVVIAGLTLAWRGADRQGVEAALRLTARFAFAFFWPSYVAGALTTLFGSRFQPLRQLARPLGLSFAAVIAVHLCLVTWLCWIGGAPPLRTFVIFGFAASWVAALAAASTKRVSHAIGAPGWWVLSNIGMNYIAFAFALDFFTPQHPMTVGKAVEYLPFAALAVLGPLLRLTAALASFARGAKSAAISPRKG